MPTKICTNCKEQKLVTLFYKARNQCKMCVCEKKRGRTKEQKKRDVIYSTKYRENNIDARLKNIEYQRKKYKENYQKVLDHHNNSSLELSDYYVRRLLKTTGFKAEQITPELIELKCITLKTTRLCQQLKN